MFAEPNNSDKFEVVLPVLSDNPISISKHDEETLAELVIKGAGLVSAEEHAAFLASHKPWAGKRRRIVRICVKTEAGRQVWLARAESLQKVANRRGRDRLSVSALVIAVAKLYNRKIIDYSGVISWSRFKEIGLLGEGGQSKSPETKSGDVTMKDSIPKSTRLLQPKLMSPEEGQVLLEKLTLPNKPTRPLTSEEIDKRFYKLKNSLENAKIRLGLK